MFFFLFHFGYVCLAILFSCCICIDTSSILDIFQTQTERADNSALRAENSRIQCENYAIREALKNVICPACGGPPFGEEDRQQSLQKLHLENAQLKEEANIWNIYISLYTLFLY